MIRAAVYLRQSLDKTGEAVAVARQRQDCLKLCADKGWDPVEYIDNDTSATNGHRKAYDRMLTDITEGIIGAVVAWDLDRRSGITRTPASPIRSPPLWSSRAMPRSWPGRRWVTSAERGTLPGRTRSPESLGPLTR